MFNSNLNLSLPQNIQQLIEKLNGNNIPLQPQNTGTNGIGAEQITTAFGSNFAQSVQNFNNKNNLGDNYTFSHSSTVSQSKSSQNGVTTTQKSGNNKGSINGQEVYNYEINKQDTALSAWHDISPENRSTLYSSLTELLQNGSTLKLGENGLNESVITSYLEGLGFTGDELTTATTAVMGIFDENNELNAVGLKFLETQYVKAYSD